MRLEVLTPARRILDKTVRRLRAEAPGGHFGLLPRHGDFITELVAGILIYEPEDGPERFVAVNSGTLVKCGDEVLVAVRGAIEGDDLTHNGIFIGDTHQHTQVEPGGALSGPPPGA